QWHTLRSPRFRRPASSPSGSRSRRRPSWSGPCSASVFPETERLPIARQNTSGALFWRSTPASAIVLPTCSLYTAGMALLRSVATVGSYTLVSRVFGFVRDILTAAILGAGPVADAFFVAQRLPNLFRSLFAEGAFSAAFVPLVSGALSEGGKPAGRAFAEEAFAVLFAALLGFVLIGEIFMPAVMAVIAPGFGAEPGKLDLTITLS